MRGRCHVTLPCGHVIYPSLQSCTQGGYSTDKEGSKEGDDCRKGAWHQGGSGGT